MAPDPLDHIGDSVMGFLGSPLWTLPLLTFIENNCIIFDTEEEHKLEYTIIWKKYKELVESLLEGFLCELGISPEGFAKVMATDFPISERRCLEDATKAIACADDYLLFRCMMTERNLELEAEVLRGMATQPPPQVVDEPPPAFDVENPEISAPTAHTDDDDALLAEALRLSAEEYEREMKSRGWDEDEMKAAIEASLRDYEAMQARLQEQQEATKRAMLDSLKASTKAAPKLKKAQKVKGHKDPFARRGSGTLAVGVANNSDSSPLVADTTGSRASTVSSPAMKTGPPSQMTSVSDVEYPVSPRKPKEKSKAPQVQAAPAAPAGLNGIRRESSTVKSSAADRLRYLDDLPPLKLNAATASAAQWVCPQALQSPSEDCGAAGTATVAVDPADSISARFSSTGPTTYEGEEERRKYFIEQRDKLRAQRSEGRKAELKQISGEETDADKDAAAKKAAGEAFRKALALRLKQEVVKGK